MINKKNVRAYCCEDISLIENYYEAINDREHIWDCHHKLEIQNDIVLSRNELISLGKYWKVNAAELIFMPKEEHRKLHNQHPKHSDEWYSKVKINNERHRGRHLSDNAKLKISLSHKKEKNPMYRKNCEDFMTIEAINERRRKISVAKKGVHIIKCKWLTPSGEIVEMTKSNVMRWHPDWILL